MTPPKKCVFAERAAGAMRLSLSLFRCYPFPTTLRPCPCARTCAFLFIGTIAACNKRTAAPVVKHNAGLWKFYIAFASSCPVWLGDGKFSIGVPWHYGGALSVFTPALSSPPLARPYSRLQKRRPAPVTTEVRPTPLSSHPNAAGLAPPLLFIRACKRFIATAPPTSHSIRRRVGSARRKQLIPHAHIKFLKTVASPLAFAPRMLYNISRAANGRTRSRLQSLHIVLM